MIKQQQKILQVGKFATVVNFGGFSEKLLQLLNEEDAVAPDNCDGLKTTDFVPKNN